MESNPSLDVLYRATTIPGFLRPRPFIMAVICKQYLQDIRSALGRRCKMVKAGKFREARRTSVRHGDEERRATLTLGILQRRQMKRFISSSVVWSTSPEWIPYCRRACSARARRSGGSHVRQPGKQAQAADRHFFKKHVLNWPCHVPIEWMMKCGPVVCIIRRGDITHSIGHCVSDDIL